MAYEAEFNRWWSGCWLKVGKLAAQREYERARKVHAATVEELLAGRDAYRAHKPSWQEWAHPKTWLHQGRWADEWDALPAGRQERPFSSQEIERYDSWIRAMGGCRHPEECGSRAECMKKYIGRLRGDSV